MDVLGSAGMALAPEDPFHDGVVVDPEPVLGDTVAVVADPVTSTSITAEKPDATPQLYVIPNPASDRVWLEYAPGIEFVWLWDATGRHVLNSAPHGDPTVTLQLEGIAPGSYLIIVEDITGEKHSRKLIKQ